MHNLAPAGKIVAITGIERFSIEQNYDFLTIYNGLVEQNSVLNQFTGNLSTINPLLSTGQKVQITFTR